MWLLVSAAWQQIRVRSGQDDDSVGEPTERRPLCGSRGAPQVPPLRYPGFPVEVGGVGEVHTAFFTESRIRGRWREQRSRKSGYASVGMTKWRAVHPWGIG